MTDDNEIYRRQQELDLNPPETVTVIGIGGVGSWVALDLALAGVEKLYLVDHDIIERHNLNRTPFTEAHIGMDKTAALTQLIAERRMDAEVIPVTDRIEETADTFRDEMEESVVVDCRDHASPLPDGIQEQTILTAGYDGLEYTLHTNPDYDTIWGDEDTQYETVPSFVAPPQFLASMITVLTCQPGMVENLGEQVASGNMKHVIADILEGGDTE